jgi:hypothetical protein
MCRYCSPTPRPPPKLFDCKDCDASDCGEGADARYRLSAFSPVYIRLLRFSLPRDDDGQFPADSALYDITLVRSEERVKQNLTGELQ